MLRELQRVAQEEGCSALVTGESLGQVASQTICVSHCLHRRRRGQYASVPAPY